MLSKTNKIYSMWQSLKAYSYFTKIRIINNFAYSFEIMARFVSNFLVLVITVFIWKAAYKNNIGIAEVNQEQMITYSIISILLVSIYSVRVDRIVNERVREGFIAIDFMRPINLIVGWFFDDIGTSIDSFLLTLLPLLIFSIAIIKVPLPANLTAFMLFLASVFLSYLILWIITAMTSMIAFWFIELGNLSFVRSQLIRILSGSFVPLWFFPQGVQKVSAFLPFVYIYQVPLSIYIGKINFQQALQSMLIQVVWILILIFLLSLIWKKACRMVTVQGG